MSRKIAFWIACVLVIAFGADLAAGETAEVDLGDMVVTATKSAKPLFETASTVDVLTADDLQLRYLSRTVPESLREIPGVMVQ